MLSKQFGIFGVADVTGDPTTARTPTDAERIHATAIIAKKVEEVGADVSPPGSITTRRSCHPHRPFAGSLVVVCGVEVDRMIRSLCAAT